MEQNGLIRPLVVGDQVLIKKMIDFEGDEEEYDLDFILGKWMTISYIRPHTICPSTDYLYKLEGVREYNFALDDFNIKRTNFRLARSLFYEKTPPSLPNI